MTEFQKQKYGLFFDFMDTENKGYITEANFLENVKSIKTLRNHTNEEEYVILRREQLSWWAMYVDIAKKNEGRVDRDSFIQVNVEYLSDGAHSDSVERYYAALFSNVDKDKNGKITPEEFIIYYKSHKWTDERHILELFRRVDLNKNGVITKYEFVNAGINFWYSTDPKDGSEFLHKPALK